VRALKHLSLWRRRHWAASIPVFASLKTYQQFTTSGLFD